MAQKRNPDCERQECLDCYYSSTLPVGIVRNERFVHEAVRYVCTQCESLFARKANLHKHLISVHGDGVFAASLTNKDVGLTATSSGEVESSEDAVSLSRVKVSNGGDGS